MKKWTCPCGGEFKQVGYHRADNRAYFPCSKCDTELVMSLETLTKLNTKELERSKKEEKKVHLICSHAKNCNLDCEHAKEHEVSLVGTDETGYSVPCTTKDFCSKNGIEVCCKEI